MREAAAAVAAAEAAQAAAELAQAAVEVAHIDAEQELRDALTASVEEAAELRKELARLKGAQ
jgi:hypothetical protein